MKSPPSISVIIPSYNSKETIIQCLNSVLNQSYKGIDQVIVVDSSDDGTEEVIKEFFPRVKLIHLREKTLPGAARNIGVKTTNSEYIAFTDSDCIVDYYWIENILRRMENGDHAAVGGVILNGTPESLSGTLGYLNEFSFYLPGTKPGFVEGLATANVCYKYSVFNDHNFIQFHFAGEDTIFHWSILDKGGKLFLDDQVKVAHKNRKGFINVLRHQRKMGEGAGVARIVMNRDLILIRHPSLSILVLPWIRLLKMYWRIFASDRKLLGKISFLFPLSLVVAYSWSFGLFRSLVKYRKY